MNKMYRYLKTIQTMFEGESKLLLGLCFQKRLKHHSLAPQQHNMQQILCFFLPGDRKFIRSFFT